MRRSTQLITGVIAVVVIGAATVWWLHAKSATGTSFQTVSVKRGDLVAVIGATGTVEPEEVVDIGAQVAGVILSFGKDVNGKPSITVRRSRRARCWPTSTIRCTRLPSNRRKPISAAPKPTCCRCRPSWSRPSRTGTRAQKLGPSEALAATLVRPIQSHLRDLPKPTCGRAGGGGASQSGVGLGTEESRLLHHQLAGQRRDD